MKYYRHTETGDIFAYETTAERDQWGPPELVAMTPAEIDTHLNPPPRIPTAEDRRAAVAAERYRHETAGITLNGMQIDTGRGSQALITGATVQAMLDPAYSLRWKTPAGFVYMTAEQIIGVASAARAHVQACFDREAELLDEINAGTYTESMLSEGWPSGHVD